MKARIVYGLGQGVLIGILGGLVLFVWNIIDKSLSYSIFSALYGFIIFWIIGFILGLLIYNLE